MIHLRMWLGSSARREWPRRSLRSAVPLPMLHVVAFHPSSRLARNVGPSGRTPPSICSYRLFSSSVNRHASPTTTPASSYDPVELESQRLIEKGSRMLEKGDVEGACKAYEQSISVKPSATGYYNLGISLYQLKRIPQAISAWEKSLSQSPSADVHTNLASAYILSEPPQPHKALDHLKKAVELDPGDGEIRFNLGAVNEANGHLEDALAEYKQALQLGVARAEQNIRNVGAKLLRQKLAAGEQKG